MKHLPTRVLVLSDLHLEFFTFEPPPSDLYDVVVLAGDIHNGTNAVHWARVPERFGGKPVILVPGNHEFYGSERKRTLKLMRLHCEGTNVHLLDRGEVITHGIRFLGATLWTDFALDVARGVPVSQAMLEASYGLNDFAGSIRERVEHPPGDRRFSPLRAAREHAASRRWLLERLVAAEKAKDGMPTVVVTHHAPSPRGIDPRFEGSRLNPCFASELPPEFFQHATLWVHGHMHSSSDYLHHHTRVIANPRGYAMRGGSAENDDFKDDLVIEVGGTSAAPPSAANITRVSGEEP